MGLELGELARRLGAQLDGEPQVVVERVAPLHNAGAGTLSFLSNRRYARHLRGTKASAVILAPSDAPACPVASLVVENPYLAYAHAATWLAPERSSRAGTSAQASVDPSAEIDPSAWIAATAAVGPGVVIGAGAEVGPGCVIEAGVRLGPYCRLVANVTVCADTEVGARSLLHPGVVLGADGFGIANDDGVWFKVPQVGRVILGADVEVGANSTIDRGALDDTVIGDGVKIDNLVQIGHNVQIGEHTAVAGCVGIAGSAIIGRRCTIGGGAGISGHLEIADDVHLTGATMVHRSISKPGVYSSGMMAQENAQWRRNTARLRQLDQMAKRIRSLEDRLENLTGAAGAPINPGDDVDGH